LAASPVFIQLKAQVKDEPPPPPPPKMIKKDPPKVEIVRFTNPKLNKEFLDRNPSVQNVFWEKNNRVVLEMKEKKKEEKYNLNDEGEKKLFTDKYGTPPPTPPPPPPPKIVEKRKVVS
jgi:hypothetical protein